MHEESFVRWLQGLQEGEPASLPGDDAAILGRGQTAFALTVDQQIGGIHVPEDLDAAVWARRLLAVNLSDLAAVGARPIAAVQTIAAPAGFPLRRFVKAMATACKKNGLPLSGGDLASASQIVTSMTLAGRRPKRGRWLLRSSARPGDRLWLGGTVGESAIGQRLVAAGARLTSNRVTLPGRSFSQKSLTLAARRAVRRHLEPVPQVDLGAWLGQQHRAAVIDVSDGLAKDLHRLCAASGVGAWIEAARVPLPQLATDLADRVGEKALQLALSGGEDYCLLFALPPKVEVPSSFRASIIGRVTETEVTLRTPTGEAALKPMGWDHLGPGN